MEMVTVECPKCKGSLQVDMKHDKIFCMYCRAEVMVKKPKTNDRGARIESLIKKGFLSLEHGEWKKAERVLNKAAEIDPENAQIYLGLLMAENYASKEEELGKASGSLESLANYQKIWKFADDDLKERLEQYHESAVVNGEALEARNKKAGWRFLVYVIVSFILALFLIEAITQAVGGVSAGHVFIYGSEDELGGLAIIFGVLWVLPGLIIRYIGEKVVKGLEGKKGG